MCGIVGGWWPDAPQDVESRLARAVRKLEHRGPDDEGLEFEETQPGKLAFGHTRLSIIDLSSQGHQPMHSPDGRYSIVYNGEIYNYLELRAELKRHGVEFRSQTDTEVLLLSWAHWGRECLRRLRGMFAFVLLDRLSNEVICVRDAFGIKPFYYHWNRDDGLQFASEVPALLEVLSRPQPLNLQRVYDYLVPGRYDDDDGSFYAGIRQLPPGHLLSLKLADEQKIEIDRWWRPEIDERTDLTFAEAAEQLREMFLHNVKIHLRSDVPIGTALSGGIDSSSIVCAMRHIEPDMKIHTFSFVARGSQANEEQWADLVNKVARCDAHKVIVEPGELASDIDDMISVQGEPFGSTSIYAQYRVFRLAREHGIKVTLDGQGADELLAGYEGYPGAVIQSLIDKGQVLRAMQYLRAWSRWPGRSFKRGLQTAIGQMIPRFLYGAAIRAAGRDPTPDWLDAAYLESQGVKMKWPVFNRANESARGRRLAAALRDALTGQGLNALLRHGDRNSMRWSIESRVPFLTTDLAEFLLSLPEHYLVSPQGETKYVFRAAMRGIVPDEILDRKEKIGFETPEQGWLKNIEVNVRKWLETSREVPFLFPGNCQNLVESILNGRRNFNYQAWRLINFCRWYQVMDRQAENR